jgi:hypothetical protein
MRPPTLGDEACEPYDAEEPEGKWRVFSDGTPRGTRVIAPNGKEVRDIRDLSFHIEPNEPGHLELEIMPAAITLVDALPHMTFVCPNCSKSTEHTCEGTPF